jgi:translation initiation factor 1
MGKRKATGKGDRLVYSEFGTPDQPDEAAIEDRPPAEQKIIVQASRKGRGGKTVTIAEGFQHAPATLKALLKQLKAQCGAGGAVKDMTIEIQGDMTRKVADVLTALGYKVKISGG